VHVAVLEGGVTTGLWCGPLRQWGKRENVGQTQEEREADGRHLPLACFEEETFGRRKNEERQKSADKKKFPG
jgi:hypothetical protein